MESCWNSKRALKHRERLEGLECSSLLHLTIVNGGGECLQLLILLRAPFRAPERSQVRAAEPGSTCAGALLRAVSAKQHYQSNQRRKEFKFSFCDFQKYQ